MKFNPLLALFSASAISFASPVFGQVCGSAGTYQTFAAYNGQTSSESIANDNELLVERSRLRIKNEVTGNAIITTNRISDTHYAGEPGVNLGHPSGSATSSGDTIKTTFDFLDPNSPSTYLPVTNLTFRLHDVDAGDNIIVNAYDENGGLISLDSTSIYTFYADSYTSYAGGNRFTSGNSDDAASGTRQGTVDFNFLGKKVRQIEFIYWDTASLGTYTIAEFKGCNPDPASPTTPTSVPANSWWSLALMGLFLSIISFMHLKQKERI